MGLFCSCNQPALAAQLARLERKLDAIMASFQIELPPSSPDKLDDIRALAAAGQTIAAIKAYRERTGASLLDAKNAVERGL